VIATRDLQALLAYVGDRGISADSEAYIETARCHQRIGCGGGGLASRGAGGRLPVSMRCGS